jgi:hypothetical protein
MINGQRPFRVPHCNYLANTLRSEEWVGGDIGVILIPNDKGGYDKYLINGQHQLEAIKQANTRARVVYKEFVAKKMKDVANVYGNIDNFGQRSLQNLLHVKMATAGYTWPVPVAAVLVSGLIILEGMVGKGEKTRKAALFDKHYDAVNRLKDLFIILPDGVRGYSNHCKHIMRAPVTHAMFLTYRKAQKDTEIYWRNVRDGENLRRKDPEFKVRDFLMTSNVSRGRGATGSKLRIVDNHEMTSRCLIGWNAFRKGTTTNLAYHPNKPIPAAQ